MDGEEALNLHWHNEDDEQTVKQDKISQANAKRWMEIKAANTTVGPTTNVGLVACERRAILILQH